MLAKHTVKQRPAAPLPLQTLLDDRWGDAVEEEEEDVGEVLEGALGALRELRHLDLRFRQDLGDVAPPASLTALHHLRGLTFVSLCEWQDAIAVAPAPLGERSLPGGAWLRGLSTLWTHWDVLIQSAPALAADALALAECRALGLIDCQVVSHEAWDAFWQFAREHPPLQRLYLDGKIYADLHNGGVQLEPWDG